MTKRKNRIDEEAIKINNSLTQYQFALERLGAIKESLETSDNPSVAPSA